MSVEFIFRLMGMVVFAILGAQVGVSSADTINLPQDVSGMLYALVGALSGLVITPWLTTYPARSIRRMLLESQTEVLVTSLVGLIFGLIVAALVAWPLSLLPGNLGRYAPTILALVSAYFSIVLFSARAFDIFALFRQLVRQPEDALQQGGVSGVLVDTSVIIDGRILALSKAGFIAGPLYITQFVLAELQNIANSSDAMRRQRGRHGLDILNALKREGPNPVEIIDDDPEHIEAVDAKLVDVAKTRQLPLMTNDFNLEGVAGVQGVQVLNLNELSLAMQPEYLPGEEILIQIVAEGKESDQGVGYLRDGTMVVVENGRQYLDRSTPVMITRYIRSSAGKMYFAEPRRDFRGA